MNAHLTLQILTAALLLAVAIREVVQLARYRNDRALRVLAPGLVCLALAASLGIPTLTLPIMLRLVGPRFGPAIDVLWLVMAYCFAAFFALAGDRAPVRTRTALCELAILVVTITALLWIYAAGYAAGAFHNRVADFRSWYSAGYDVISIGYVLTISTVGIIRAIRYRRALEHLWLRRALWLVIVGAAAMSFGVNVCAAIIGALHALLGPAGPHKFLPLDILYGVGQLGGQTALAAGLVLPTLAEAVTTLGRARDRNLRRRYKHQMTYLHESVVTAFPYIVLPSHDPPETSHDHDFARATSEIADGLAQLSPYYPPRGQHGDGHDAGVTEPGEAARIVHAALDSHAAGGRAASAPYARIEPDFRGWRDRARWMSQVSQSLNQRAEDANYRANSASSS
jgi:hypothetical protein